MLYPINASSIPPRIKESLVMPQIHIWQEERVKINDSITVSATIEIPNQGRNSLWFRVQAEHSSLLTQSCDSFVVAMIFLAMSQGTDVLVHGEVSPSLLQNLEEFQAVWSCWRPKHYQQVEITVDIEREHSVVNRPKRAISAFSGGLDSCFSAFRHSRGKCGRSQRPAKLKTKNLLLHTMNYELLKIFTKVLIKDYEIQ